MIFLQRTFTSLVHAHAGRTQNAVGTPFGRWDANTGPLRDYSPMLAPQSLVLYTIVIELFKWILLLTKNQATDTNMALSL